MADKKMNWVHDKTKVLTEDQFNKLPKDKRRGTIRLLRSFGYTVEFEDGKLKTKLIDD